MRLRTAIVLLSLSILDPVTAPVTYAKTAMPARASVAKGTLPGSVQATIAKGDFSAVRDALIKELKDAAIAPDNKRALNLSMALETVECTSPRVLTDFAADRGRAAFLKTFFADPEWQEIYLGCGLVPYHTDRGLKVLYDIWKEEGGNVKNKPLACALASVWGGGETWENPAIQNKDPSRYNPVRRYKYFQRQAAKNVLHPGYKNLKAWELRFVVGIPGQDWDDESYEWAYKHVNMPWDQYGWACWYATYTDPSKFGDSVQSGEYNLPFSDESWAEATQRNGGVCGALSHFGAVAAMAHGIPAYTVGQPGHCAYAIRVKRGEWIGGFGGPDGGMHNYIFGDRAPTSYNLMEAVFGDDAAIADAYRRSYCARALAATGREKEAIAMWKDALNISPMHPFFRAELHKLLKQNGITPDECFKYLMDVLPRYKGHGMAAVNMMGDLAVSIGAMDEDSKLKLFTAIHKSLAATPASWAVKCEDIMAAQTGMLQDAATEQQLLSNAFAAYMNDGDGTLFGQILEWAVRNYVQSGREDVFTKAFAAASCMTVGTAPQGVNSAERSKKMSQAYGKAILAAEQARSATAFAALSAAALKACPPADVKPEKVSETPPGKLAKAVLFRISTTCGYDRPVAHSSVLTPNGGRCHTDREIRPNMIVELADRTRVTGCVVRKVPGNEGRMKKATVAVSTDGATWFDQATTRDMPSEWVVQFKPGTVARWVRIEFQNDQPNFAHISHFLIYTK